MAQLNGEEVGETGDALLVVLVVLALPDPNERKCKLSNVV